MRRYVPPGASRGGAVIFLQHGIYKNSVSFVEAEKSMDEQITCIKNAHFRRYQYSVSGSSKMHQNHWRLGFRPCMTPLGKLQPSPNPDRTVWSFGLLYSQFQINNCIPLAFSCSVFKGEYSEEKAKNRGLLFGVYRPYRYIPGFYGLGSDTVFIVLTYN